MARGPKNGPSVLVLLFAGPGANKRSGTRGWPGFNGESRLKAMLGSLDGDAANLAVCDLG